MVELWERLRLICASCGTDPKGVQNLALSCQIPMLATEGGRVALRRFIRENRLDVVFVDPLSFALAGAATAIMSNMAAVYGAMISICTEEGCTPVLVHHTTRGARGQRGKYAPADFRSMTGAGTSEFLRAYVMLSLREAPRECSGRCALWLNAGGSAGHRGLYRVDINEGVPGDRRWAVTCEPASVQGGPADASAAPQTAVRASGLKADAQRVLEAMRSIPDGETASAIRGMVGGMPYTRFTKAVAILLRKEKNHRVQNSETENSENAI